MYDQPIEASEPAAAADLARDTVVTERVEIEVENGPPMGAYLARPAGPDAMVASPVGPGPCPGVVVAMELFGVTAHVREVCERLAGMGFNALAPDLYHRTAPGIELPHDLAGRERGFELLRQMTREQALADVRASIDHLRTRGSPRVGMIGLSLGGHVAYLAATELDLAAVAVLYGGWIPTTEIPLGRPEPTLTRTAGITGRMLVLVGENDHAIPPEHRLAIAAALEASGVQHEIVEYTGASHGFLCDRRDSFEPGAAADAWLRIEELLVAELSLTPT